MTRVFISYSHKDDAWRKRIVAKLSQARPQLATILWDDSRISPGSDWVRELERARSESVAALLLVSSDYLQSSTVREEVQHLLELGQRGGPRLMPVLLSPCAWQPVDWLRRMQLYPEKARPLSALSDIELDSALTRLADVLVEIAGDAPAVVGEKPAAAPHQKRRLVILVHGIRTRAEWQSRVRHLLEQDPTTEVVPIGYGYFDVFRFLFPVGTRRFPVNEVLYKIRDALQQRPADHGEVIFVGHSFGTYILATILRENPDIRPDRVLLCGSIVSRTFRWDQLPNRPMAVLNEAGSRDVWPVLAQAITWGYGSTGTFGFQTPGVRDRYHNLAHSDYFKRGFAEKYWVPWIADGSVESTPFERDERPPLPWYFNVLEVAPLRYLAVSCLVLLTALFVVQEIQRDGGGNDPHLVEVRQAVAQLPAVHAFVAEAQQRSQWYGNQPRPSEETQNNYAREMLHLQTRRYAANARFVSLLSALPPDQAQAFQEAFNRYLSAVEALMQYLDSKSKARPGVATSPDDGRPAEPGLRDERLDALHAAIDEQYSQTRNMLEAYAKNLEHRNP